MLILFPLFSSSSFRARIPQAEQHQVAVLGKRYTAEEGLAAKIINEVCPMEELREKAIEAGCRLAGKEGLNRKVLASIKYDLYRDTYRSLMDPVQFYSPL